MKLSALLALPLLATPVLAAALTLGQAKGKWNLPTTTHDGKARGMLVDANQQKAYELKATLVDKPAQLPNVERGVMKGVLDDHDGALFPLTTLRGHYKGDATTHAGEFEADVFRQATPLAPEVKVGHIKGKYTDKGLAGPVGMFKAKWAVK